MSAATATAKQPKPGPATDIYYVVGPGSIRRSVGEGKDRQVLMYGPNDLIELTDEEARIFGSLVARGEPPKPQRPAHKRQAGKYVVAGPGVLRRGVEKNDTVESITYKAGDVVQLSAEEARALGNVIREA